MNPQLAIGQDDHLDLRNEWHEISWAHVGPIPRVLILGDIAHNLRSALDHLMWQMVLATGGTDAVGNHTQFPISDSKAKWADDITDRDVERRGLAPTAGLSNAALDFVESVQPYQHGAGGQTGKRIRTLHVISNLDKHRLLHAVSPYSTDRPKRLRFEPSGYISIEKKRWPAMAQRTQIENGTPLVQLKLHLIRQVPEDVRMHVKFEQSTNIRFIGVDQRPVIAAEDLPAVREAVVDIIEGAEALDL